MNPWRAALLGGLAYGLAFALWLIGGLGPGPLPPDLAAAERGLFSTQLLALALLLPAVAADTSDLDHDGDKIATPLQPILLRPALPTLLLVAVPWPLVTLMSLAGGATSTLIAGQLVLSAWSLVLGTLWHLLGRIAEYCAPARGLLQATALLVPIAAWPYLTILVDA